VKRREAERRGRVGEWIAMLYLVAKGYRVIGHRLRTPYGEVDLAAWKGGVLVIVEVKTRKSYAAGAYALTPAG
jgi:putative endonuclease